MKTVYILGAGFSAEAGAPTQEELISEAFRLHALNSDHFDKDKFQLFEDFLLNQLNVPRENFDQVLLEDIFTPIDRCLSEGSQFRGVGLDKIIAVREAVFYIVGKTIQLLLAESTHDQSYIDTFAAYLTRLSSQRSDYQYNYRDPVSVISTNWDMLLDNSIKESIRKGGYEGVVDYCCYISAKEKDDDSIKPGLEKLGQGGFNVKLLKLHGSLNWLQCQRCMRLYASFFTKVTMHNGDSPCSCRHCDNNFPEEKGNHLLVSNLIMPTFIKDLSNPQYKTIWQNAGIEISEADKLVFIGYSLPSADFEMRQLLSRMTRRNAKIEVIGRFDKAVQQEQIEACQKHWRSFFGSREIEFTFSGAKDYIESLVIDKS